MTAMATIAPAPESRSGLPAWKPAELPEPPDPRGLGWLPVVGPGVITLGAALGSGEFLLGPAAFVKHGLTLLWVVSVAAVLQTVLNTELMRYTLATGEPATTGFMRLRPRATFWATTYSLLFLLQVGWPAWAGTAAGAAWFLGTGRLPGVADQAGVQWIGTGIFVACVLLLTFGRRIERTLELLNWALVSTILVTLSVLAVWFVPGPVWRAAAAGFCGFEPGRGFVLMPAGADMFLIGAFAGYAGLGGIGNLALTNWARDKGYGMSKVVGYIPAALGGGRVDLAATGYAFTPDATALQRWRGWWRIVRVDQWGIFFIGALLGMALPALLYVTFIPRGTDIRGLAIAAELARAISQTGGVLVGKLIALLGGWMLFKTQLDLLEGLVRCITDMLWTSSTRVRRCGDVRTVYYLVLALAAVWGVVALRLTQPVLLLQLGANLASLILVLAALQILWINTRLLPPALRPAWWRRIGLVALAVFYGVFVVMGFGSLAGD